MLLRLLVVFLQALATNSFTQEPNTKEKDSTKKVRDSLKKTFLKHLGNGLLSFNYFNLDLRYLVKFNQYVGFRTGFGGIKSDRFSER